MLLKRGDTASSSKVGVSGYREGDLQSVEGMGMNYSLLNLISPSPIYGFLTPLATSMWKFLLLVGILKAQALLARGVLLCSAARGQLPLGVFLLILGTFSCSFFWNLVALSFFHLSYHLWSAASSVSCTTSKLLMVSWTPSLILSASRKFSLQSWTTACCLAPDSLVSAMTSYLCAFIFSVE